MALDTASLWTLVRFKADSTNDPTFKRQTAFLQRSKQSLLDIRVTVNTEDSMEVISHPGNIIRKILELVCAHSSRWRTLVVDVFNHSHGALFLQRLTEQPAPFLNYIHFCVADNKPGGPDFDQPNIFQGNASLLRTMRLIGVPKLWFLPIMKNVTEAQLYAEPFGLYGAFEAPRFHPCDCTLRDMLLAASNLTSLTIVGLTTGEINPGKVLLPFLRSLCASFNPISDYIHSHYASECLGMLVTPNLENMRIYGVQRHSDFKRFIKGVLARSAADRYPRVTKLHLDDIRDSLDDKLCEAFPAVRDLELGNVTEDLLFESLAERRVDPPWPSLRTIALRVGLVELIGPVVRARHECGFPLRCIRAHFRKDNEVDPDSDPDSLDEDDRESIGGLRELVRVVPPPARVLWAADILNPHIRWAAGEVNYTADREPTHDESEEEEVL